MSNYMYFLCLKPYMVNFFGIQGLIYSRYPFIDLQLIFETSESTLRTVIMIGEAMKLCETMWNYVKLCETMWIYMYFLCLKPYGVNYFSIQELIYSRYPFIDLQFVFETSESSLRTGIMIGEAMKLCETMWNYVRLCETMWNYVKLCETMWIYMYFLCLKPYRVNYFSIQGLIYSRYPFIDLQLIFETSESTLRTVIMIGEAMKLCETMWNYVKLCKTVWNYVKLCETMWNYVNLYVFSMSQTLWG